MRDPKRIHPFLVELEAFWSENPDWRFGQLVHNLYGNPDYQYNLEDDVMFEQIRRVEVHNA